MAHQLLVHGPFDGSTGSRGRSRGFYPQFFGVFIDGLSAGGGASTRTGSWLEEGGSRIPRPNSSCPLLPICPYIVKGRPRHHNPLLVEAASATTRFRADGARPEQEDKRDHFTCRGRAFLPGLWCHHQTTFRFFVMWQPNLHATRRVDGITAALEGMGRLGPDFSPTPRYLFRRRTYRILGRGSTPKTPIGRHCHAQRWLWPIVEGKRRADLFGEQRRAWRSTKYM